MKLITNVKTIKASIAGIRTRGADLDNEIQLVALSVMQHAAKHGDTTLADSLVNALSMGQRRKALVEFILAYGPMAKLDKKDKSDAERIQNGAVFKYQKDKPVNLAEAQDNPWYNFRKHETEALEAFDVHAAASNLIKRYQAAQKKGLTVKGASEARQELEALLATLKD